MHPHPAHHLSRLVKGRLRGNRDAIGSRVVTDSRAGLRVGDIFIGLVGPHFDGGRFAAHALEQGAAIAVVGPGHGVPEGLLAAGKAWIVVKDPLAALHQLAGAAREEFRGLVLAITGSNGKTTVKDMLVAALSREMRVSASPMSYNSQVGVALALLQLDPHAQLAVIECGISLPGEMERLQRIVRPDFGILTNVGDAHAEGLGSRADTAREKAQLFRGLGFPCWVLVPDEETLAQEALMAVDARIMRLGSIESGCPFGMAVSPPEHRPWQEGGSFLDVRWGDRHVHLQLAGTSRYLVDATALAVAAALRLGVSPAAIEAGLAHWQPAPMRLEMIMTRRGVLLINDAYSADPTSMEAALRTLQREGTGAAVAVLGGMAQLGVAGPEAHRRVGQRVAELKLDRLVGVGPGGAEIAAAALAAGMAAERVHTVAGVDEAAAVLEEHCRPGDRVLLKGSRPERLEGVAARLFDSVAPARLYVDLDAIVANFQHLRQAAGRGCGVMAVVKSWGYGLDSGRISRALEHAGVDYLAVAYPDEGVLLRDRGITAPILVQNVLAQEVDKIVRYGLTAEVADLAQVPWLEAEAARQQRAVRVHLKVDTGMGRAGVFPEQLPQLVRAVQGCEWLVLEGLMTHFAAADDPSCDDFTREQIRRFDAARQVLAGLGVAVRWQHAANSAGVARFPEARYSMVRAGLALFGYYRPVDPRAALHEQPVLRLVTQIVSVKVLPPGHFVGYGLTFTTPGEPRRIAMVAIGYNDGYPWALSNKGWMLVHGVRCPVVGRVCMDVTMIDVTAAGERAQAGDEVVVFGPDPAEPSLNELAELAGTIPYELLTRISPRVRRIFRTSH